MEKFETYLPSPRALPFETVARMVTSALGTRVWPVVAPHDGGVDADRVWLADDTCLIQARRGERAIQAIVHPTAYSSFNVAVTVLEFDISHDGPDGWPSTPVSDWILGGVARYLDECPEISEVGVADAFAHTLAIRTLDWDCDADDGEADS